MPKMVLFSAMLLMPGMAMGDEWTRGDVYREGAYLVAHAIDWQQTLKMGEDEWQTYHETNGILGKAPSSGRVDRYFALTAIGHVAMANLLPANWRSDFQYFTIGMEVGVVLNNYSIGVRVGF